MKQKRPLRWAALLLAATTCASLAGCDLFSGDARPDENTPAYPTENRYYRIYPDDYQMQNMWVFDHEGNLVQSGEAFTVLCDVLTKEPQCKMLRRTESTGERDTDGNLILQNYSALYDMDGNLLHDWQPYVYSAAFGDFVIRQSEELLFFGSELPENFESMLWNYKTGDTLGERIGQVQALDNEHVLLTDALHRPIGVVDRSAKAVSGFPSPEAYAFVTDVWNGYLLATNQPFLYEGEFPNSEYYLLNKDFEEVLRYENLSKGNSAKYLFAYETLSPEQLQGGLMNLEGEIVFEQQNVNNEWFIYYNNDIVIVQRGDYDSESNPIRRKLVSIEDGAVLADDYSVLEPDAVIDYGDINQTIEQFVGYKDGMLQILDNSGAIVREKEVPGIQYVSCFDNGFYSCSLRNSSDENTDLILNSELEVVIPAYRYNSVYKATEWSMGETESYPLLVAHRSNGAAQHALVDVLDLEGNVLVEGLNRVYQVGPDRLAVKKGFDVGLMDWQGNWVAKQSTFAKLLDD